MDRPSDGAYRYETRTSTKIRPDHGSALRGPDSCLALNHPPSIDRPHYDLNKYTETQQLLTLQCDSTIHCETFITSCNKKFSNSRALSYSTKGFFDMLNRLGMIMSLTANRQTDGWTKRQTKTIAYSGDKPISIKLRV